MMLQITQKCNLHCAHCFANASGTGTEMSLELIQNKILPQLLKNQVVKITLTGGEPLCNPQIKDIVQLLLDNHIGVSICTNATLIDTAWNKMRKGLFISVDGPNGAGKTTFIRTLVENLSVNYDVYDTREPSPTSFGTFVKKNEGGLKGMQYAQLIWADRHYHLQTCVQPQLSLGKIVVCDRYIDSSFVLQGFDGVSEEQIWELNKSFLRPDLNIILLADPEILQKRLQKRESLSAFEKRMTREEEIYMYRKAIDFLSRKNIPHIIYMNNTYDELQKNLKDATIRIHEMTG